MVYVVVTSSIVVVISVTSVGVVNVRHLCDPHEVIVIMVVRGGLCSVSVVELIELPVELIGVLVKLIGVLVEW